ncbi:MAG TPA: hypothetical protein VMW17_10250 [Candidatus Binatia bacterium]|nr:hypothetical protein [Candidatus Binatia bacterium]
MPKRRWRWVLANSTLLLILGCNNDNLTNHGEILVASRFKFVTDQNDHSRLLFDSATGDVWRLQAEAADNSQWVRMASGPSDVRVLTTREALLGASGTPH